MEGSALPRNRFHKNFKGSAAAADPLVGDVPPGVDMTL